MVYAYYEKSSPEHLKFRTFVDYWQPDDKVFYSFVTYKEREDALKNKDSETALRDALLQDGRSRVREYDMQEKPSVDIPTYLKDTGLGNVPGRLYFWVENENDDKLKDIYSEKNENLSDLIYDLILPRVMATFGDGSEAWSGSVEKGTKIYLKVGETYYQEYDYAIQYTLDGTYPGEKKDTGAFPADLFTQDKDVIVYKPEKPIVINEDTILRAVAYPVKNGEPWIFRRDMTAGSWGRGISGSGPGRKTCMSRTIPWQRLFRPIFRRRSRLRSTTRMIKTFTALPTGAMDPCA